MGTPEHFYLFTESITSSRRLHLPVNKLLLSRTVIVALCASSTISTWCDMGLKYSNEGDFPCCNLNKMNPISFVWLIPIEHDLSGYWVDSCVSVTS